MHQLFITGATGKIGRSLVRELGPDVAAGRVAVRAGVRSPERAGDLSADGAALVRLDYDDWRDHPERHVEALRGSDVLFLLTGYTVDMLVQSKALVDGAKKAGVRQVVHLGAHAADDTTVVHLHLGWHQYVERYVEASGLAFTHLRPNWFMQNVPWFSAETIARDGTIEGFIPPDRRVSWVDCDDIAAVAAAILRDPDAHAGRTYPLASQALSYAEVAEVAAEVTGRPFRYASHPWEGFLPMALAAGQDPEYAKCVSNVMRRTGDGSLPECADVFDTLGALTGRKPTLWRDFVAKHRGRFAPAFTEAPEPARVAAAG